MVEISIGYLRLIQMDSFVIIFYDKHFHQGLRIYIFD